MCWGAGPASGKMGAPLTRGCLSSFCSALAAPGSCQLKGFSTLWRVGAKGRALPLPREGQLSPNVPFGWKRAEPPAVTLGAAKRLSQLIRPNQRAKGALGCTQIFSTLLGHLLEIRATYPSAAHLYQGQILQGGEWRILKTSCYPSQQRFPGAAQRTGASS